MTRRASKPWPTLDAMQLLSDDFHALADSVLRHQYPGLRTLRSHGLNDEGKPIHGTPDSYVGASPEDCSIAVEHTTTALEGLSGKFLTDYAKVVEKCPRAGEIYLCTNRRETAAVSEAVLARAQSDGKRVTVVWGEDIARTLDEQRQDLRKRYLQIDLESLTPFSLIPALQQQLEQALDACIPDGFDALDERRMRRRALDVEFHRLRPTRTPGLTVVLGDAGLGKTTWSASTARALALRDPVVWFPATLAETSGLAGAIGTAVYGEADGGRAGELGPLVRTTRQTLTIFVDGLDEVGDYARLGRVLHEFIAHHPLARVTHLVLTCRTEAAKLFQELEPALFGRRSGRLRLEPLTAEQSVQLLRKAGSSEDDAARLQVALPGAFFGNPLYLRLARAVPSTTVPASTEVGWLGAFADHCLSEIARRLRSGGAAPAPAAIRTALGRLALATLGAAQGIDPALSEVHPLFDADVTGESTLEERAVQSGLLVRNGERLRFAHALLGEYFAADAVVRGRETQPAARVDAIARLPRRASVAALAISMAPELLHELARRHPALTPDFDPAILDAEVLTSLVEHASDLLRSASPSERRAAVRILGSAGSRRARRVAIDWFDALDARGKVEHLREAADLFLRLELESAAHVVVHHLGFMTFPDFPSYDSAFARRLEATSLSFRSALASHAARAIDDAPAGSGAERRYTAVLAYLRDRSLLDRLRRKAATGPLANYEHRALIHLDSQDAMAVYEQSRRHWYAKLDAIRPEDDASGTERANIWHELIWLSRDVLAFAYAKPVVTARRALESNIDHEVRFGIRLCELLRDPSLVDAYAQIVEKEGLFMPTMVRDIVEGMAPGEILALYQGARTTSARKAIIRAAHAASGEVVEDLLLGALEHDELFESACRALTSMRSIRAGEKLHARLSSAQGSTRRLIIQSLGRIRYAPAIDDLLHLLSTASKGRDASGATDTEHALIVAIGSIGGPKATKALVLEFQRRPSADVLALLLEPHDAQATRTVRGLLDAQPCARHLLPDALHYRWWLFDDRGTDPTYLEPDLEDHGLLRPLIEVAAEYLDESTAITDRGHRLWIACRAVSRFRHEDAHAFLARVAERDGRGSAHRDIATFTAYARGVLARRGNPRWMRAEIAGILDRVAQRDWVSGLDRDELREWPSSVVRELLLDRTRCDRDRIGYWMFMLLDHAEPDDTELFRRELGSVRPEIADLIREHLAAP